MILAFTVFGFTLLQKLPIIITDRKKATIVIKKKNDNLVNENGPFHFLFQVCSQLNWSTAFHIQNIELSSIIHNIFIELKFF